MSSSQRPEVRQIGWPSHQDPPVPAGDRSPRSLGAAGRVDRGSQAATDWVTQARGAGVTAVLVLLVGAPAGLAWAALRPSFDVALGLLEESRFEGMLGTDLRLAGVLAVVGAAVGLVAWCSTRREGTGVVLGLLLGGLLSAYIASRVGALAAHPEHLRRHTAMAFADHRLPPLASFAPVEQDGFVEQGRFELRARQVLFVLPLVSTAVFALLSTLRDGGTDGRTART
jgi:hypothetical protein